MNKNTLGSVASIVMGQSPPGQKVFSERQGIPLLNGPTEFGNSHPTPVQFTNEVKKIANPGDLLFCVRGSTTGRMNWADQPYVIGRGLAAIRHITDDRLQPLIRAVIENQLDSLLAQATGSTFPNVSSKQLSDLPFPDISPSTQLNIATVLGALDTKIELNRKISRTYQDICNAFFKSWFVDFDPVIDNAIAAGNPIPDEFLEHAQNRKEAKAVAEEDEGSFGLPFDLNSQFPNKFEESELGPIPSGWRAGTFSEICGPYRISVSTIGISGEEKYVGLEHIPKKSLTLADWGLGSDVSSQKSRFKKGQLLFGKLRPYFHKVSLAPFDGICSTDILALEPRREFHRSQSFLTASSDEMIRYVTGQSDGTRMPRTSWNDLGKYVIPIPDEGVSKSFDRLLAPMFDRLLQLPFESETLRKIRLAIIPNLISGAISVSDDIGDGEEQQ